MSRPRFIWLQEPQEPGVGCFRPLCARHRESKKAQYIPAC